MGNCVSREAAAASTAKVIHVDGTVEEYASAVRAGQVAARSPGCYVCSSEAMEVGEEAPGVPEAEELRPGELYFLMPVSKSRHPLSLQELCRLAVTASAALASAVSVKKEPAVEGLVIYRNKGNVPS